MASGTEVGKAYVQIMPSAEGLSGSISDLMSGEASKAGASAGGSFSGAFAGALKGTGAVLAGTAVAIGGVTAALVEGVSSTAKYADSIDKASQKLGVSSGFYQEMQAVMEHSGTSMDSMTSSFKKLSKASQDMTDDQRYAFEQLGISMDEVEQMSSEDLFMGVLNGLQGMEESTERTYLATTLLGNGAMEMGALLNTSAEDTQAMIDRVTELGGVLDDDAIKNGAAFTDALQDMNTALEGLKNGAFAELMPAFTTVIDGLTDIFSGNESGIGKIAGGIGMISSKILEQLPVLLETGSQIVQSLVTAILANMPAIATTALTIITDLAGYLIDNLDMMLEVSFQIILSLTEGLIKTLPTLIAKVVEIVPKIAETIAKYLPLIIKTGIALTTELLTGIIQALPELIAEMPTIINEIINALLECIDLIVTCGIELITALTGPEALPQIIKAISGAMPEIVTNLIDALIKLYPLVITAGLDLFMCLLENMPTIYLEVGKAILEIINSIIDKLVENWPELAQSGQDALFQIFDKIAEVITLAENKAKEIIDAIIDKFKSMAEDFKDIGTWIIEQIAEGIASGAQWLKDKISGVIKWVAGDDSAEATTTAVNSLNNQGYNAALNNLNANASIATSAEINVNNNAIASVYNLLSTYLPEIAEGDNVTVEVNADIDNMFNAMQKKANEQRGANRVVYGF